MDFPFDSTLFYQSLEEGNIVWRKHTLERMLLRSISRKTVIAVMSSGEIIQVYDYDRPFPSVLLLGFSEARPIHVVTSLDETRVCLKNRDYAIEFVFLDNEKIRTT